MLPTTVAVVQFPNVQKATEAVVDVMNKGVGIRMFQFHHHAPLKNVIPILAFSSFCTECVELVDSLFITAINKVGMSKHKWPEKDSLFFKFQGPSAASIQETAEVVKGVVEKHGGTGFQLARSEEEANDLWSDRKNAHYAGLALAEGCQGWPTDVWYALSASFFFFFGLLIISV